MISCIRLVYPHFRFTDTGRFYVLIVDGKLGVFVELDMVVDRLVV